MKKVFDIITWSILSFLLIPSGLVLASWNSVPGDPLYAVKLGLEKSLLAVVPSSALQSSLQVKYAERRFDEASQVLDTNLATEGLTNLDQQLMATTLTISQVKNAQEQSQLADSYIQTLTKVSEKLEEKRQMIALAAPTTTLAVQTAQTTQQVAQMIQTAPQSQIQQEQTIQPQTIQQPVVIPPSGKEEKTTQNSVVVPTVPQEIPKKISSPPPLTTPTQQPKVQTNPPPSAPPAVNTSVVNKTEVRLHIGETQHKIAEEIKKMQVIKRETEKHQVQQGEDKKREDKQKETEKKEGEKRNIDSEKNKTEESNQIDKK